MSNNTANSIREYLDVADPQTGEAWGLGANLDNKLNLRALSLPDRKRIYEERLIHEENRLHYKGTDIEQDIPQYGMLRIMKTNEGILLFVEVNNDGIQSEQVDIKYLTNKEFGMLATDNANLWFDYDGHHLFK